MTRNILSKSAATRRKVLKFGAAASVLPWVHVRGAAAAGKLEVFLWDHWVPATNVVARQQVAAWAEKNKVEVKLDFITSQGQQTLLTVNAQAQARRGHDVITLGNWLVQDHADKLEVVDDVMRTVEGYAGKANEVANYLGKSKGRWAAMPSTWGTQNKGPAGRISLFKEYGVDLLKMYPTSAGETAESKAWTMDEHLRVAEAAFKAGKPFGIGLGTTADSVDTAGAIFASFGAELVDAAGKIQIRSAAVRQALEYCQKLVRWLPTDAQSWDDASNNRSLISGSGSMIWNPPSAWAVATRDAPAVAQDVWHFPPPAGPRGRFMPHNINFFGIWQFSPNKSAAKEFMVDFMQPAYVDARCIASLGYDLPPYEKLSESKAWDTIGPPVGSVYNYPIRPWHNTKTHVAHAPAPPEIAVQIYNRGTLPTMLAKLKAGESIDQVITWGNRELEGFI